MRTCYVIVVVDIYLQNTPQMSRIQDENKIQALCAYRPHPAFGIGIRIWGTVRCQDDIDAFRLEDCIENVCELLIPIVNQEAKGGFTFLELPHELSGLLDDPIIVGIGSDASQLHTSCAQVDEEQDVQRLQPERFYGEEVTSQNLRLVMRH